MDTVVTLICNPAEPRIGDDDLVRVLRVLEREGAGAKAATLAPGVAIDLRVRSEVADRKRLAERIRSALAGAPVDVVVQPAEGRRKRLLVADMDSTIIEQECLDELADFAGRRAEVAAITERAMRGELDFEGALKARVAMLKGLGASALETTFRERISLTPGARVLVTTMKRAGAATALVSGGFTYFTSRVADLAGFDRHDANELLIEAGALTGRVGEPIKGRSAKEAMLVRLAGELGVPLGETMAVGDGANDLSMLARAGLGVAFRAKPAVAAAAAARIDHGDLTALLYIQGYAATDFAR